MTDLRFAVILVTYNRLSCLKTALAKYEEQTKLPAYVLVVDNASTDGTQEYLREWQACLDSKYQRIVVRLPINLGGAGGYSRGLEEGVKLDCDFLFTTDDDAYPETDTLEKLVEGYLAVKNRRVAAVCAAVLNHDEYDISHRERLAKGFIHVGLKWMAKENYKKRVFQIDLSSFIGLAVKKEVAAKLGTPFKDYFIHYDDIEYSLCVGEEGNIYCIPASIMHHDNEGPNDSQTLWKHYYDVRNWIYLVRRHFPRRYYWVAVIDQYLRKCSIVAAIVRKRSKSYRAMCLEAISDGRASRLGLNKKYFPKQRIN